ncbi:MAG TPA: phosphoribosylglycinamide formyltransferase [Burkholderiales bacterium]|nr:phosphoribosylglycinamide formyltransferase [Burkholderiales bacterium]
MAEKRIVILISGRGSNMGAILGAGLPARIAAVISNEPKARGLELARAHHVETAVVNHRRYPERADFEAALGAEIDRHQPDLVIMAGFMRILAPAFVERYRGRIMNIHPSLLPAFPGLDTHRRALEAGVRVHGCTVHFVNAALDNGPIIIQAAVPVQPGDTEERLAARVLAEEHRIYPQAIRWFCEGRIKLGRAGAVDVDTPPGPDTALASPPVETH